MNDIVKIVKEEHTNYFNKLKFETILVIIAVIFILLRVFNFKGEDGVLAILVLIVSVFIGYSYINIKKEDLDDQNKVIMFKFLKLQEAVYDYVNHRIQIVRNTKIDTRKELLDDVQVKALYNRSKLDDLYIDSDLIEFLYSIITLKDYNEQEFYLLVKSTNDFLKIRNNIEIFYDRNKTYPKNIAHMYQAMMIIKTKCINHLQTFIYTVPKDAQMYNYIDKTIPVYTNLLNHSLSKVYAYYTASNKINGTDIATQFIQKYNYTQPFDPEKSLQELY